MILRFTFDHLRASRVVGTRLLASGGYLATSVDQLVTLFATLARSLRRWKRKAYPLRGSEKRTARASIRAADVASDDQAAPTHPAKCETSLADSTEG